MSYEFVMQSLPLHSRVHQGLSGRGDRRVSPGVYFHCEYCDDLDCDLVVEGQGHDTSCNAVWVLCAAQLHTYDAEKRGKLEELFLLM